MRNLKQTLVCLIAVVFIMGMAACQPTPQTEAVVGKGGGALEEQVLESAQTTGEEPPKADNRIVWSESRTVNFEDQGDYTVAINMDIEAPEMPQNVPVYLIEPQEFSIDSMKRVAEYLMPGEIFDGKESKEDVEKELLDFEKDVSAHTILQGYEEQADGYREFMNTRYEKAADSNSEANFEYNDKEFGERLLHLKSYTDDNSILELFSNAISDTALIDHFSFRNNRFNRSFRYLSEMTGEKTQPKDLKITYDEALAAASDAMTTMFEEPFAMAHSDVIDLINHQEYLWHDGVETSVGQAYVFYFVRSYDGIPSLFIDSAPIVSTDSTEYAAPYAREGVLVAVDDSGIADMWYDSYSKTVEKINDNVGLMPFDQVLERFKDGIFYHSLWGFPGTTVDISITGVEFGMVREPVKDNPDQYMMVPAWNFIGNLGTSELPDGANDGKSMLTLSAIDGSIVTNYEEMVDPK